MQAGPMQAGPRRARARSGRAARLAIYTRSFTEHGLTSSCAPPWNGKLTDTISARTVRGLPHSSQENCGTASPRKKVCGSCGRGAGSRGPPRLHPYEQAHRSPGEPQLVRKKVLLGVYRSIAKPIWQPVAPSDRCHGPIDRGWGGASVLPRAPRILFLFLLFYFFLFSTIFFHKLCNSSYGKNYGHNLYT
jgi:hypothetical protein